MESTGRPKIRILLANDQDIVRLGLKIIFQSEPDLDLVAVAGSFEDTVNLSLQHAPDITLFDCMLREGGCIEKIPELLNACPSSKILVLTACPSPRRHLLALRSGAIGIFVLHQPIEILIKAIHKVVAGEVWIPNNLTSEMLKELNNAECTPQKKDIIVPIAKTLTSREFQIARLLAQGLAIKQVAAKLFLSEKTIRNQLVIIYSKLGVHNHIELLLQAAPLGLKDGSENPSIKRT